ncbi:MAG: hypothetical protein NVS2B17_04150 [Candidatus Velthaea sp.]
MPAVMWARVATFALLALTSTLALSGCNEDRIRAQAAGLSAKSDAFIAAYAPVSGGFAASCHRVARVRQLLLVYRSAPPLLDFSVCAPQMNADEAAGHLFGLARDYFTLLKAISQDKAVDYKTDEFFDTLKASKYIDERTITAAKSLSTAVARYFTKGARNTLVAAGVKAMQPDLQAVLARLASLYDTSKCSAVDGTFCSIATLDEANLNGLYGDTICRVSLTAVASCRTTDALIAATGYDENVFDPLKLAEVVSRLQPALNATVTGRAAQPSFADYAAARKLYAEWIDSLLAVRSALAAASTFRASALAVAQAHSALYEALAGMTPAQ